MPRMAAVDAQFYWMSAIVPNDEFLLYVFDGEPDDVELALEQVRRRAQSCPQLAIRAEDDCAVRYPRWSPADVGPECTIRHDLADNSWDGCLSAVVALADNQLSQRAMPWRIHVFAPVHGVPGVPGPSAVVVMQATHAFADGRRGAALAAFLFGRDAPVPAVPTPRVGLVPLRAVEAVRTHRQLIADTEAGLVPPALGTRRPLATNARPRGARSIRTLVRHRSQLPDATVTVGVLAAVADAMSEMLGGDVDSLGAEVPIAKSGARLGYNHFANAVVGLYPRLAHADRLQQIASDLAGARRRLEHPAVRAGDRAFATVPAALLRWGVSKFDVDARPAQVSGNTVVSSVHRGAADLLFGGVPVALTAGYPSLSPLMGLTHGVHGIGDTVAVSVNASESAVPDVDAYVRLLDAAL